MGQRTKQNVDSTTQPTGLKWKAQCERKPRNRKGDIKTEAMRYQIIFDGKPEPEVRDLLKSNGFKWAPSQGAWQRQITSNGRYALGKVVEKLKEREEAEQQ